MGGGGAEKRGRGQEPSLGTELPSRPRVNPRIRGDSGQERWGIFRFEALYKTGPDVGEKTIPYLGGEKYLLIHENASRRSKVGKKSDCQLTRGHKVHERNQRHRKKGGGGSHREVSRVFRKKDQAITRRLTVNKTKYPQQRAIEKKKMPWAKRGRGSVLAVGGEAGGRPPREKHCRRLLDRQVGTTRPNLARKKKTLFEKKLTQKRIKKVGSRIVSRFKHLENTEGLVSPTRGCWASIDPGEQPIDQDN